MSDQIEQGSWSEDVQRMSCNGKRYRRQCCPKLAVIPAKDDGTPAFFLQELDDLAEEKLFALPARVRGLCVDAKQRHGFSFLDVR